VGRWQVSRRESLRHVCNLQPSVRSNNSERRAQHPRMSLQCFRNGAPLNLIFWRFDLTRNVRTRPALQYFRTIVTIGTRGLPSESRSFEAPFLAADRGPCGFEILASHESCSPAWLDLRITRDRIVAHAADDEMVPHLPLVTGDIAY
jgi:hypothetical protein